MRLYADNAIALLSGSVTVGATVMSVQAGQGALFPSPSGTDYFIATLQDAARTKTEKVRVTARNTDTFTVTRAQEGTSAQTWAANDFISLRWTKSSIDLIISDLQYGSRFTASDTGTAAAYAVTLDPNPGAYALGLTVKFITANQNSGAATLNVNGLGARSIRKFGNMALSPGDLLAAQLVEVVFDGTNFQLISPAIYFRPGMVMGHSSATIPPGWLQCNAAAVSRTTYANLFTVQGTVFGPGDGSTTFNLPDLRGRTLIGSGQGIGGTNRVLGAAGGTETHVLTVGEMPAHTHTEHMISAIQSYQGYVYSQSNYGGLYNNQVTTPSGSAGGGGAHNNMPPFQVFTYIVKT